MYKTYAAMFKVDLLDNNRSHLVGFIASSLDRDNDKEKDDKFKPRLISDSDSVQLNERQRLIEEHKHPNITKPSDVNNMVMISKEDRRLHSLKSMRSLQRRNKFIKSSSDKSIGDRDRSSQSNQISAPDVRNSNSAAKSQIIKSNSRLKVDEQDHSNDQKVNLQRNES